MQDRIQAFLDLYMKKRSQRRKGTAVLLMLSVLVAATVSWTLKLNGIALAGTAFCGQEEHTHSEECYEKVLICGYDETETYRHSEDSSERVLICGQEEREAHQHSDECYEQQRVLVCQETEHVHGDACYKEEVVQVCKLEEKAGHTHGTDCYDADGTLVCTQEECEGHQHSAENGCYETRKVCTCDLKEHTHTDACYGENSVLICGLAEEGHTHTDACYEQRKVQDHETEGTKHVHTDACYEERLICGKEEHVHTVMCYSDQKADLESAADWERTLPKELALVWSEDLVQVARSQLGYTESTKNYIWDEEYGRQRGYTRYGAWYGNAYGDWCAMFVSFCLNYAQIPKEAVPYASGCHAWTVSLDKLELYERSGDYLPAAGDIIFFDYDHTGSAGHVGIVTHVEEKDNGEKAVHTIEGNSSNTVREREYPLSDHTILGYADLTKAKERYDRLCGIGGPEEEMAAVLDAVIYTDTTYTVRAEEDTTRITVTGILPEGAEVKACPVTVEIENQEVIGAYDIAIFQADGTVYEPEDGQKLEVRFTLPEQEVTTPDDGAEVQRPLAVYYVPEAEEGMPEQIHHTTVENNEITFEAEHFSVYAVVRAAANGLVMNEADFKAAFDNAVSGEVISLGDDFTVTNANKIKLDAARDITLDLNGHKLTAEGNTALFTVSAGTLTITDSQAQPESAEQQDGKSYLTYSVTESRVVNPAVGATNETLAVHTVELKGCINPGTAPAAAVSGGNVNLESGMLCSGTNRAFDITGGSVNLNGGYIFGFKKAGAINTSDENFGGAVRITGGALNITGTVLANNEALNGGAIYANNADINISGGVISGNESTRASGDWDDHSEGAPYRCGGGGIFANGSTALNMSGGYITNNTAADDDYFDGGGGVLISGTTRFAMSGGYITGNEAAGGGGVRSDWNKATTFLMSGGFISGNTACSAEGGGVAITQGGTGTVTGGYITNNTITNTVHWGGGGLFCSDGAYLRVYHVLVTDNHAGGFGGGVAGCSTGRVYICVKDGGAIYDNSASGTKLSDGGSQKNEDHVYAADSPVFMDNGYQDYFCALNSMVEGSMLGGGSANWSGSIDGVAISNVPSDALLEAAYIMGLTAHPSDEAIAAAQGVASVFINGNSSDTHGGGILCNGYLLVGDRNPIAVGSRFTLKGTKKLLEDGKDVSLQGYQFTFSVKDEAGNIVSIGTSDESGNINFDRLLSFNEELCRTKIELSGGTATFVYYLTEDESLNTVVDKTQYKISVTIKRTDQNLPFTDDADKPIVKIYYQITGVTVEKSMDEGETWQAASYTWTAPSSEQHGGELKITNGATFTNQKTKTVSLIVHKQWVGTGNPPESIKVDLLSDGTVIDTVDLNADNHWSYRWDKLAEGSVYTVEEHPVPGYEATYENGSGSETVKGWIPAVTVEAGKRYLIVAADNTALTGSPNTNGAYYFGNGNFKNVIISDKGIISDSGITEEMQWEAVSFSGRAGVYLKNLPSAGKHYLSYQIENGNHNVKATSDTTSYATKVVPDCSNGLKLYRFGSDDTQNIRYVMKSESTLKASESDSNAVRLYVWAGGDDEHVITITNTKVSKLYDVDITKVSAMDPGKTLAGAEFQLLQGEAVLNFSYDAESGVYTYTRETAGDVTDTLITGEGGRLHLTGLPEGTYQLHETKAPSGYELAADTEIQLGETNESVTVEYTIEDQEILYSLPETGGNGTYGYILWGLLLMTTSLGIYGTRIFKNRKERGEYKS